MYIYNVTTNVEETAHDTWVQWMKEIHIPQVLSTGKFLSAKFSKVLVEEDMGGFTYSVQYTVQDKATLERYYEENAPALVESIQRKFAGQLVSFKTELEIVDEYFVQRAAATHYLFTYGTLQDRDVQLGVFSRPLNGFEDELPLYIISEEKVADLYPTLQHTGVKEDVIKGQVYTLSHQELEKADSYEGEAYERIQIQLASGKNAWTYIAK
ncbi:gamma-glutamyl AIG2-like cyclotransferase [Maribacter spongiicola]|uniref:Gamma-glutamyl AIG2-like cyclotransferase n=1 Tax=Maribacter spongiicola TaxID=1206753 RepID=A0A4R7K7S3_9FLAO|nr:gamma-glutamyl AIG2-like cyclotransferase [Maribacter spongiicola]